MSTLFEEMIKNQNICRSKRHLSHVGSQIVLVKNILSWFNQICKWGVIFWDIVQGYECKMKKKHKMFTRKTFDTQFYN